MDELTQGQAGGTFQVPAAPNIAANAPVAPTINSAAPAPTPLPNFGTAPITSGNKMWKWGAAALGVLVISVSGYLIMQQPSEEYKGTVGMPGIKVKIDSGKLTGVGGDPSKLSGLIPDVVTSGTETILPDATPPREPIQPVDTQPIVDIIGQTEVGVTPVAGGTPGAAVVGTVAPTGGGIGTGVGSTPVAVGTPPVVGGTVAPTGGGIGTGVGRTPVASGTPKVVGTPGAVDIIKADLAHKECQQKMIVGPGVWEWNGTACQNLVEKFARDCVAEGAAASGGRCTLEGIGAFDSIDSLRRARGTYQACIAQENKQWNGTQMACEDKPVEVAVNQPPVEGEPVNLNGAPTATVSSIGEERTVTGRPTGTQIVTVNPSGSASAGTGSGTAPSTGSTGSTGGGQSLAPSTVGATNVTVTSPATKPVAVKIKPKTGSNSEAKATTETGDSSASTDAQANAAGASDAAAASAAASASIAKKVHGAFIQGETGPSLLLYPVFIAGANGLFYLARRRKNKSKN